MYFPPENCPFYSDNAMSGLKQLEDVIIRNNLSGNELLVNGDFNARTGNLMKGSHNIQELEELNDIVEGDIGLERVSKDTKINRFGRKLIELCKVFSC